jgi:hypothetical protein
MIRFGCPSCGVPASAPEACAGRTTKCRQCGGPITVPSEVADPSSSAAAKVPARYESRTQPEARTSPSPRPPQPTGVSQCLPRPAPDRPRIGAKWLFVGLSVVVLGTLLLGFSGLALYRYLWQGQDGAAIVVDGPKEPSIDKAPADRPVSSENPAAPRDKPLSAMKPAEEAKPESSPKTVVPNPPEATKLEPGTSSAPLLPPGEPELPAWTEYASEEGKFRVFFPSKPKESKTKSGSLVLHFVQTPRTSIDGLSFGCQWTVREKPFSEEAAQRIFLWAQQQGFVKASKGKLVETKTIKVDGSVAQDYIVKVAEADTVRGRALCLDRHCYHLQIWGKDAQAVRSAEAERFFASFKSGAKPVPPSRPANKEPAEAKEKPAAPTRP